MSQKTALPSLTRSCLTGADAGQIMKEAEATRTLADNSISGDWTRRPFARRCETSCARLSQRLR